MISPWLIMTIPDDWKYHKYPNYDSEERFFTDYEQELPCDDPEWRGKWENYVNAHVNSDTRIPFAFENHEGEYVGGRCSTKDSIGTKIFMGCWQRSLMRRSKGKDIKTDRSEIITLPVFYLFRGKVVEQTVLL